MDNGQLEEYYQSVIDRFYLEDHFDAIKDMTIRHKYHYMLVEFPREDATENVLSISLMAPYSGIDNSEVSADEGIATIDDAIQSFKVLKRQHAALASKGYEAIFNRYDDGFEFIYTVPFKGADDLGRILKDFSFSDGF